MSTNLATILVGLGYDLSALEKGAPEAFRLINQQTLGMSAEMKRASREGAESWRLIDEALGIHVSRPLTRIVTQEFPGFANAMQSLLGAGVIGALGVAGIEFFDKLAKSIEKAQKAQEALKAATEEVDKVYAQEMNAYREKHKAIEASTSAVDKLAEAMMKQAAAEAEANGPLTKFLASSGEWLHVMTSLGSTLGVESITKGFVEFKAHFDELSRVDAIKGTHTGAEALNAELQKAKDALTAMQSMRLSRLDETLNVVGVLSGQFDLLKHGFSPEEMDAQAKLIQRYKELVDVQKATESGARNDEAKKAAIEAQREAIREAQGDLKRWNDSADEFWKTWIKINEQIDASVAKLRDTALGEYAARQKQAQRIYFPGMNDVAPPSGAPGLADAAELEKVTTDQNEAWKKAGQILEEIETPLQKYNMQVAILKELQTEGRLTTDQFTLAMQKAQEEMDQATRKLDRLTHGWQAFKDKLKEDADTNRFIQSFSTKALEGFEDETAKVLTGAKASWRSFFLELDQMAIKFMLSKLMQKILNSFGSGGLFSGLGGGGAGAAAGGVDVSSVLSDVGITAFASGTDYAPGGLAWVGENGPELMNVPAGSSITPAGSARGTNFGGFHINIDAKGAEIGVEEKIARALSTSLPHMVMRAVVETAEIQRRTPQR